MNTFKVTTSLHRRIKGIASDRAIVDVSRRGYVIAAAAVLTIAILLRFWNLASASIGMDEGATRAWARLPLDFILFNNIDVHPPLTYAVQHVWHSIFPSLEMMRVPAALAGIASVAITVHAVRDHTSRKAALITGALLAVSTAHVYYSQDARMYPFLMCGLMAAFYGSLNITASRWRVLAYVIGALIAIYSHAIGLIAMAIIGGAGLIGGYLHHRQKIFVPWFTANLIVLLFALPWLISLKDASQSFYGLGDVVSVYELHWFYRNAIGAPGLLEFSPLIELLLLVLSLLGAYLAFVGRKYTLAMAITGLCFVYPAIIGVYHLHESVLSTRVMLPSLLGTTVAVGFCLSQLQIKWQVGLTALLITSFSISTFVELNNRFKFDQNREATQYAVANGMGDAPHISCNVYSMAGLWEARPDIRLYNLGFEFEVSTPTKPLAHYQDPSYWRVLENGSWAHQNMTATETAALLGDDWIISGGLIELLASEHQAVVIDSYCNSDHISAIQDAMAISGFHLVGEMNYQTQSEKTPIFVTPKTIVRLYERSQ